MNNNTPINGTTNEATSGATNGTTNGVTNGGSNDTLGISSAIPENLRMTDPSLTIDGRESIPDTNESRLVRTMLRDEGDRPVREVLVAQEPGETFVIHRTREDGHTVAIPASREVVDAQREAEDMAHSSNVTIYDASGNIDENENRGQNGHQNGHENGDGNGYDNNTPLDQFNIKNILGLDIMDSTSLSLNNMGLFIILSTILITYVYVINNNFNKVIPNNTSASSESIYHTVYGIVISQINEKKGQQFFPLIFVLFVFILTNNLIGMIPYTFATTSHFILTFSLSFTIVLGATFLGFYLHQIKLFSLFVPSGCPLPLLFLLVLIEFISYLSRPVSLGLRLAANVLSGHMLLNILSGFTYNIMNSGKIQFLLALLPLAFVIAFSGLEVGVAFIQAQVFIVLSSSYIKDGFVLH